MVSEEQVLEAMKVVIDPEIGINIVDLGLVYGAAIEDSAAKITFTLTSMGCPIGPMLEAEIKAAVGALDGIDEVQTTMVFEPAWGPEKMSDMARSAMGVF